VFLLAYCRHADSAATLAGYAELRDDDSAPLDPVIDA
jgi:hypothetical protein